MTNGNLMKAESIAECFFWPALNDNWSWKPIFGLFKSGRFTQVLLYISFRNCIENIVSNQFAIQNVVSYQLTNKICASYRVNKWGMSLEC